jgi:uncharacterized protein YecE (DUF72 family)
VKVHVGTSGFAYPEWKGSFYPEKLPAKAMLGYYADRFTTVEINNTFYRMPSEETLRKWASEVPDGFVFVLKAPQRITHQKRLREVGEDVRYFMQTAAVLEGKRGPTLVQLPPNFKKDIGRLADFVSAIPQGWRTAFEFRNATWFSGDVYDVLRAGNHALVLADTGEGECPIERTADWGYLRLRRVEYSPEDLDLWARRVGELGWQDAFVFFKHEDEATGPRLAADFRGRLRTAAGEPDAASEDPTR